MWKHASLNRRYRLVWNRVRQCWSVAPEIACGQGKAATGTTESVQATCILPLRTLAVAIGCAFSLPALALDAGALPTGGNVVAGQASLNQSGSTLTVNQGSDRAIVQWQSFNIGKDAAVQFVQPSSSSVALNRVTGGTRSEIYGSLTANGQVYLVNSAGVLFGSTAQVDVGGIVASTLDISNDDFLAGKNRFVGNSTGEIINQGSITAHDGGTVVLIGSQISNTGQIVAQGGNVALAAGKQVTFAAGANGHLQIAVDATEAQALVHNGGLIQADGGQVILTAQGANALASAVVSNTGTVQARTVAEREGTILLLADFDSGTTNAAGTLDASAPTGGNGGFIETSAAHVTVADSTKVTTKATDGQTGTWLIDPDDFTVAASGGDMTGATVAANLANTHFSIATATMGTAGGNGDIHIDDAISWSADTTLTLNAERNINVNAAITATGTNAGLVLNYGGTNGSSSATPASGSDYNVKAPITLSGSNSTLSINGNAYTLIRSMAQLDALDGINAVSGTGTATTPTGRYALAQDLDASGTTYSRALVGTSVSRTFNGTFAGLGHSISNLTISANNTLYLGLFGITGTSSVIRDIGLVGGSVASAGTGNFYAGGLVGNNGGSITNAYTTGSITGTSDGAGGLVGYNSGSIANAYATGSVEGKFSVGGLAGYNVGNATISNAYATGSATATNNIAGGLVGQSAGTLDNVYATGNVAAVSYVGGLAGYNSGTIDNAYAVGNVTGTSFYVGGLVGWNANTLAKTYATGSVTGATSLTGGLVGYNTGIVATSFYATTDATGTAINNGGATTGFNGNANGTGKTWAQLTTLQTFTDAGWAIDDAGGTGNTWRIYAGHSGPLLRSLLKSVTVTTDLSRADKTYDGSIASGSIASSDYTTSLSNPLLLGTLSYASTSQNAGTYSDTDGTLTLSGLYSNQQGYDISYDTGASTLIISKANLTLSTSDVNKTYDGTTSAAGTLVITGGTLFGSDSLSGGTFAYSDANAGSGKTVTTRNVTVSDGNNGDNYAVTYADNTGSTITAKAITVTATSGSFTYGDTGSVNPGLTVSGLVNGESASVLTGLSNSFAIDNTSNAGSYVLTVNGTLSNGNYVVTQTSNGTWIVDPKAVMVTATSGSSTYGDTGLVDPGLTVSGLVNGQSASVLTGLSNSFAIDNTSNAGSYTLTVNGTLSNGNYVVTQTSSGTWVVDSKAITVTATGGRSTYGDTGLLNPGFTASGLVNGQDESALTGLANSFGIDNTSNAGSHTLTVSGTLSNGNYVVTQSNNGTWVVDPKAITVAANSGSSTYGDTGSVNPGLTASGLVNGQDESALTGLANSFAIDNTSNAGSHVLTVSGTLSNGNYVVTQSNNGTWVVDPKAITVTATSGSSTYGATGTVNPGLTVSGLVNGESASILTGLSNSFAIDNSTDAGSYVLTVNGTLSNGNYLVTQTNGGTWEVNRKVLTVQANSDRRTASPSEVYSGGNGVTYSGFVNGEDSSVLLGSLSYGGSAQGASRAGTYVLSVSGLSADNYAIQYVDGRLLLAAPLSTSDGGQLERPVRDSLRNLSSVLPSASTGSEALRLTVLGDPMGAAN